MAGGLRLVPQILRTFNSASFTGSYQKFSTPLLYPACLIKFVNNSNVIVTLSWDGINDHDVFPMTSMSIYDVCTNAGSDRGLFIAQGTQFYIKGSVGTGNVYLVSFTTSEL